jgi:hypothetical protein
VRADVAKSKRLPSGIAPEHQRNFEQLGTFEPSSVQAIASQRGIPESPKKFPAAQVRNTRFRNARFRNGGFAHREPVFIKSIVVQALPPEQSMIQRMMMCLAVAHRRPQAKVARIRAQYFRTEKIRPGGLSTPFDSSGKMTVDSGRNAEHRNSTLLGAGESVLEFLHPSPLCPRAAGTPTGRSLFFSWHTSAAFDPVKLRTLPSRAESRVFAFPPCLRAAPDAVRGIYLCFSSAERNDE